MAETPTKTNFRFSEENEHICTFCCCSDKEKRLDFLLKPRETHKQPFEEIKLLFDLDIPFSIRHTLQSCATCRRILAQGSKFVKEGKKHVRDIIEERLTQLQDTSYKRVAKTPGDSERINKRANVCEQIISSVEKLKIRDHDHDRTKDKGNVRASKQLFSTTTSTVSDNEAERLNYEHSYSTPLPQDPDDFGTCQRNAEQIIKDRIKSIPHNINVTQMRFKLTKLSNPNNKSILFNKDEATLISLNIFAEIINEMDGNCCELLDLLIFIIGDTVAIDSKISTIATVYGMLMNCLNKQASAVQRLFTSAAVRYHADTKFLSILNKIHVTLAPGSKTYFTDQLIKYSEKGIIRKISEGFDGKLNGDNLDFRVTTNDIRMENKNKDYHFFASDWISDRVNLNHLSDDKPVGDISKTAVSDFLPSSTELSELRQVFKIHLGKKLCEFMPMFEWMKSILPVHIEHPLQEEMTKKSSTFVLPIMLKNEQKYSECVQIMDEYVKQVNSWYSKAGRGGELDELQVPIGGDQLTRVRLQGAKALRAGSHTKHERLELIEPTIIEMFHTVMDFLEKMCKKFLKLDKATDKGTLANLKVLIQRSNVNGNIKSRFQAHEQFIDTSGTAYLLVLVMNLFKMKSLTDKPSHPLLPPDIELMRTSGKKEIFDKIMDLILDAFLIFPFEEIKEDWITVDVDVSGKTSRMKLPVNNGSLSLAVLLGSKQFNISCSVYKLKCGVIKVAIPGELKPVTVTYVIVNDELNNYVINFMNWFTIFITFNDAIKEGNIFQTNILLKLLIPFFYSHSPLSKYMTECLDYIIKTEYTLTPKMALKVRAASFVNTSGRKGHNKAADMHKENEVMVLKDLIKGLGANKTESSIVKVSKAGPIVQDIVSNLTKMMGVKDIQSRHHQRSMEQDVSVIVNNLIQEDKNPWLVSDGRKLCGFKQIQKSPFVFDRNKFESAIQSTKDRLIRNVNVDIADVDEELIDQDQSNESL